MCNTPQWALAAAMLCLAGPALAQDAAEGAAPGVAPKPVNPGAADAPGELLRASGLEADGGVAMELAPPAAREPASTPAADVGLAGEVEASALRAGQGGEWSLSAVLHASVRASYQGATPFPVQEEGTPLTVAPLMTRVRVSPEIHYGGLGLIAEADTATGAITGVPGDNLVGTRVPYTPIAALELRKLYLEYKWKTGAFRVGQQTSNWGLGLLANDGGRDPEAGDFGQQQFGNLTYRALLAARPFYTLGGDWRAVETAFAADLIYRDTFGEFVKGDRAWQAVLALRLVKDNENQLGVYAVYRNQRNAAVTDGGKATDALVVDVAGKWQLMKRRHRALSAGFEVVTIQGTTTQARNENAALLRVGQFGAAAKLVYRARNTSFLLDWGFASGDQNPSDDRVENFRFDRDFKVGLVLFDQVLAYQSARASVRASDPGLTGVAPEGADLLGTGGGVTGAWYLFPRVKVGVTEWLDLYGGPLFAFSTAKLTDPFATRIGGGTSRNSLGAAPGSYLGTEIDLGVQARFHPVEELTLTATGEGGLFLAGEAFRLPSGGVMGPVGFGRIRLGVSL